MPGLRWPKHHAVGRMGGETEFHLLVGVWSCVLRVLRLCLGHGPRSITDISHGQGDRKGWHVCQRGPPTAATVFASAKSSLCVSAKPHMEKRQRKLEAPKVICFWVGVGASYHFPKEGKAYAIKHPCHPQS